MPEVSRTPDAEEDLLQIWIYVAQQSASSMIADRLLDRIDEKCRLLARHPEMGPLRPDLAPNVRAFPVDSYVVFYRAVLVGIEVLRVLHGARDIPSAFARPPS